MAFPAVKNGFERGKRSSGRREFDPRAGPCRPLSSGEDLGTEIPPSSQSTRDKEGAARRSAPPMCGAARKTG
jgi:hypothetical protein